MVEEKILSDLGIFIDVGYRFSKNVIVLKDLGWEVELVNVEVWEYKIKIYYKLEYVVKFVDGRECYNLVSVVVSWGKFFIINIFIIEKWWEKVNDKF